MTRLHAAGRIAGPPLLAVVLLVSVLTLSAGYALKAICLEQEAGTYPPLCYTDVTALYGVRGLDRGVIPYFDFPAGGWSGDPGFLEYPVGTGAVMTATAAVAGSSRGYLLANALVLSSVALLCSVILTKLAGLSALRWAAAPVLSLYAFHNWDLLAVGAVVGGCFAAARRRPGWAGTLFGAGIALKLYPVLFLVPLLLERLWARDRAGAARAAAGAATAALIPNLAVAIVNRHGWWVPYAYHSARVAELGSIWGQLLPDDASPRLVNVVSALALLASGAAVLAFGWRRAAREGVYPFLPVASALVVAFLLWSKVASPQYTLWLLPSLVLLRVRLRWWLAWNLAGAMIYLALFGVGLDGYDFELGRTGIGLAAGVRVAALLALGVVFMRALPRAHASMEAR